MTTQSNIPRPVSVTRIFRREWSLPGAVSRYLVHLLLTTILCSPDASAVRFAKQYQINIAGKHILTMDRKDRGDGRVKITLQPPELSPEDKETIASQWHPTVQQIVDSFSDNPPPLQALAEAMQTMLVYWAGATSQAPQLTIEMSGSYPVSPAGISIYTLGTTTAIYVPHCPHWITAIRTLSAEGITGQELLFKTLGAQSESPVEANGGSCQQVLMFSQQMEAIFDALVSPSSAEAACPVAQTLLIDDSLFPLFQGGVLGQPFDLDYPGSQTPVLVDFLSYNHQLTYNPSTNTIIQQSPPDVPAPGISFSYHIGQDGVIDSICAYESGSPQPLITYAALPETCEQEAEPVNVDQGLVAAAISLFFWLFASLDPGGS